MTRRLFYIASFFGAELAERLTTNNIPSLDLQSKTRQDIRFNSSMNVLMGLMFKFRIHFCYIYMTMPMQDSTPVRYQYGAFHLDFVLCYSVYLEGHNSSR